MGRRRRRVIRIVKKKLPTVFVCPRCGEEAVRVTIAKDTGRAVVLCALCSLRDEFPAHPAAQPIDVYSYFTDRFYGVKDPRAIMPREREITSMPVDEEPAEETAAPERAEPPTSGIPPQIPEFSSEVEEPKMEPENAAVDTSGSAETQLTPATEVSEAEETVAEDAETASEDETTKEEDNEPFADILENKDKKRYSPNPLPQQSSEQTS